MCNTACDDEEGAMRVHTLAVYVRVRNKKRNRYVIFNFNLSFTSICPGAHVAVLIILFHIIISFYTRAPRVHRMEKDDIITCEALETVHVEAGVLSRRARRVDKPRYTHAYIGLKSTECKYVYSIIIITTLYVCQCGFYAEIIYAYIIITLRSLSNEPTAYNIIKVIIITIILALLIAAVVV